MVASGSERESAQSMQNNNANDSEAAPQDKVEDTQKPRHRGRTPSEEGEVREETPPLPDEEVPGEQAADDGWEYYWNTQYGKWAFYNRKTGEQTLDNPRESAAKSSTSIANAVVATTSASQVKDSATSEEPKAPKPYLGYLPSRDGDYDPNAWYAKYHERETEEPVTKPVAKTAEELYTQQAKFNRFNKSFQTGDKSEHHSDANKSKRQMEAFFDVDRAANMHDGKSLKEQRQNRKPTKQEIKEYNEKRRERKEKKRRDFLLS